MTTREVAGYLRIKERKVYDLLRGKRIPSTRVTGKWLFPKHLIDQWVADGTEFPDRAMPSPPPVLAGSHDPLLEWSLNESGCGLALMPGGSLDGLERLAAGEAVICGLHVFDPESGDYNRAVVERTFKGLDVVLIEWAWREQGLVVAQGNPLGIATVADLKAKKARVVARQPQAGAQILFRYLVEEAGLDIAGLDILDHPAMSETDLGLAVLEDKADAAIHAGHGVMIGGQLVPHFGQVGKPGRHGDRFGRKDRIGSGGIAKPRPAGISVRVDEADGQKERARTGPGDEGLGPRCPPGDIAAVTFLARCPGIGAVRAEVHLADDPGGMARRSQQIGRSGDIGKGLEMVAAVVQPVLPGLVRMQAGLDDTAAAGARGGGGECVGKARALRGQSVDIGGPRRGIAVTPRRHPEVIGDHQQNVAASHAQRSASGPVPRGNSAIRRLAVAHPRPSAASGAAPSAMAAR